MTIFVPFGGEAGRGNASLIPVQTRAAAAFRGGTGSFEVTKVMHDGDLLVIVMIERNSVLFEGHTEPHPWVLVKPLYAITALDGIKEAAGPGVRVTYALGVSMQGEDPGAETPDARATLLKQAVTIAGASGAAIVVVGNSSKLELEGYDRSSMALPAGQDELIEAVAAANKNTIVVVIAGAPVTMTKWIGRVPAVVLAWYGGQEAGHAIADIAFGLQNPSGKLPVTFPKRLADSPRTAHIRAPISTRRTMRVFTSGIVRSTNGTSSLCSLLGMDFPILASHIPHFRSHLRRRRPMNRSRYR
ncbi:MAG: glycoside hydrolase family 3 C-terminal domain-containing protein [Pseudomonadota bacterium]